MIHYLDPDRFYTDRTYLTQWFEQDILVITDNDFTDRNRAQQLFAQRTVDNLPVIIDISHNPWPDSEIYINGELTLSGNISHYYTPLPGTVFFPVFLWMFSQRSNFWHHKYAFESHNNKSKGAMCLNNLERPHRTQLYNLLLPVIDRMTYTYKNLRLPDETHLDFRNDIGVDHPVYSQCSVNIVTETETEFMYLTEKICKPFMARQIPVLVAGAGTNQFLQDVGLDMFSDLVPWESWDSEKDTQRRVNQIADFVKIWVEQGSMLEDYKSVIDRIELNKQYFHSEKFRNTIMYQLNRIKF